MSPIALAGICYDRKSSFLKGPASGPQAIRQVMFDGSSNFFSENGMDISNGIEDIGNFHPLAYMDIEDWASDILHTYDGLVCWGGDHSVTYPLVRAFDKRFEKFDIVHFDAHSDTYEIFNGDPYSHACPFARIMEEGLCRRLVQVGIRTLTSHQRDQLSRWNITCFEMDQLSSFDPGQFDIPLYISLDLDVFDPAFAPGVSHIEPGGLSSRTVLNWIHQIKAPILGADIVEYNPTRDHSNMTAYLAVKITKEIVAQICQP